MQNPLLLQFLFLCLTLAVSPKESQLQVGVSNGGLYECTPNVVSEGKRTDFAPSSSPFEASFSRINFCLYSVKQPIEYRLDIRIQTVNSNLQYFNVKNNPIGYIKTFDGASSSIIFHNKTAACGLNCNPDYASLHTVEIQCIESGIINAQAILFYPQTGDYHLVYINKRCDRIRWGKVTGDLAHAFESRIRSHLKLITSNSSSPSLSFIPSGSFLNSRKVEVQWTFENSTMDSREYGKYIAFYFRRCYHSQSICSRWNGCR